jgi:hypothetical protein
MAIPLFLCYVFCCRPRLDAGRVRQHIQAVHRLLYRVEDLFALGDIAPHEATEVRRRAIGNHRLALRDSDVQ